MQNLFLVLKDALRVSSTNYNTPCFTITVQAPPGSSSRSRKLFSRVEDESFYPHALSNACISC